jgi:hypothetical protein
MRLAIAVLLCAVGCGGGPRALSAQALSLLGKPCAIATECAPAEGVGCEPLWLDAPVDRACELRAPGRAPGDCPPGTILWIALLTMPDVAGRYQTADYCGLICYVDSDCSWGRNCGGPTCTR